MQFKRQRLQGVDILPKNREFVRDSRRYHEAFTTEADQQRHVADPDTLGILHRASTRQLLESLGIVGWHPQILNRIGGWDVA